MSFIELAKKRRSIRKYKPNPVPDELIKELLEAARLAPSGCNVQPWKYVVLKDRKKINQLVDQGIYLQDFIRNAPILIVGCEVAGAYEKNKEGIESQIAEGIQPPCADKLIEDLYQVAAGSARNPRAMRDIAISMTHIVYRAEELGLGTCFVGTFYPEPLATFLDLSIGDYPCLSLTVGYSNESPEPRPRKPLSEIIYTTI